MVLTRSLENSKNYIPHDFNGWGQRYDRIADILNEDELIEGHILGANVYLIEVKALWKKSLNMLQKNPSLLCRCNSTPFMMRNYLMLCICCLTVIISCRPSKQLLLETGIKPNSAQSPDRFEEEIAAFGVADQTQKLIDGGVLFTGSSSVRIWKTLEEDMAPIQVLNRGFGGSTFPDLLHYFDEIILPHKPNCIVVYEGDNDINSEDVSPKMVLKNLKLYQTRLQQALPGTKTLFLSVKPSISRKHLLEKAKTTNSLIQKYCEKDDLMEFVDVSSVMMENEQKIRSDIFIKDSLHMNTLGYELWTPIVRKALETHCQ